MGAFRRDVHEFPEVLGVVAQIQAVVTVVLGGEVVAGMIQHFVDELSVAIPEKEISRRHFAIDNFIYGSRFFFHVQGACPAFDEAPLEEQGDVRPPMLIGLIARKVTAVVPACIVVLHGMPFSPSARLRPEQTSTENLFAIANRAHAPVRPVPWPGRETARA